MFKYWGKRLFFVNLLFLRVLFLCIFIRRSYFLYQPQQSLAFLRCNKPQLVILQTYQKWNLKQQFRLAYFFFFLSYFLKYKTAHAIMFSLLWPHSIKMADGLDGGKSKSTPCASFFVKCVCRRMPYWIN